MLSYGYPASSSQLSALDIVPYPSCCVLAAILRRLWFWYRRQRHRHCSAGADGIGGHCGERVSKLDLECEHGRDLLQRHALHHERQRLRDR
jgi:hypothetical protein